MISPVSAATAVIGVITLMAMLHAICTTLLRQIALHHLRVETQRLRAEYARRLAEHRRGREESIEVLSSGTDQDVAKAA